MSNTHSYGSPAAFRRALTDKLRAKTRPSRWTLPQLQRQMAYRLRHLGSRSGALGRMTPLRAVRTLR